MIDEIRSLDDEPAGRLSFEKDHVQDIGRLKASYEYIAKPRSNGVSSSSLRREASYKARKNHDFLKFNRGATRFKTIMWWFLGEDSA